MKSAFEFADIRAATFCKAPGRYCSSQFSQAKTESLAFGVWSLEFGVALRSRCLVPIPRFVLTYWERPSGSNYIASAPLKANAEEKTTRPCRSSGASDAFT